ncbi:vitamin K epoxide reductase family protein [Streptomyces formicae]|uniref:Vitamin K epoxide reductase family protein n=1 Tax=Streptomyces formicae TaxID=1616117 RepID=A0ABY3WCF5_9ACTN|nr:vitamin K epoxide reductase family protein [Streptomyces formicae]UNM10244.1 vitamin K epoxide reductase family protein [Streptomyces formicae]
MGTHGRTPARTLVRPPVRTPGGPRVPRPATAAHDAPSDSAGARPGLAWLMVVTGAAGLLASWVITIDKFALLEDPDFTPGCSLNPVVSCGSVMKSEQAAVFGFPNPMLGLVTYAVVIAVGAGLLAGARYGRRFWLGLNAGTLFGVGFCTWLQFQSLYRINALCLWCSLAWVATIFLFCHVTRHTVEHRFLPAPEGLRRGLREFGWVPPVVWTGAIGMLVLTRWWDFWTS